MRVFVNSLIVVTAVAISIAVHSCRNKPHKVQGSGSNWSVYRGDDGINAFSSLDQINRDNVHSLEVAWTYRTGDTIGRSSIQCNPIVIDGILYGISPRMKLFALDAASGKEKWIFNPFPPNSTEAGTSRGLAVWQDSLERRLFYAAGYKLFSIDAATGKPVMSFGDSGFVDMRKGLKDDSQIENYYIRNTSPGVVYNDLIIIGSSLGETYAALPGNIRAYDVRTGRMQWMFNTIPKPGEYGYESWPKDAHTYTGGCNAWSGLSIDRGRGIVFAATGAPVFDFHGGDRKGDNLFANSIIALDAATGKRKWHFQVSHHDLWDYDLPSPPNLTELSINGEDRDVVVQVTKQGFVFVLDRDTGEPVFPVEERSVPASWMPDETASVTQPFPLKPEPLVPQGFDTGQITNISAEAHNYIRRAVDSFDFGNIYTPPNKKGIIQLPGFRGGAEWSGAAIDDHGIMYIGVNNIANIVQLEELPTANEFPGSINEIKAGELLFQQNCSPCHGADRKGNGPYPALINIAKRLDAQKVGQIILNGRGNMPSFAQLSDAQRNALVAYLLNLKNNNMYSGEIDTGTTRIPSAKKYKIKGYVQLRDAQGYPGTRPPWGMLKALDLNTGKINWSRPLGEYPELIKKGIPATGTQLFGGAVVTAGGLIFIGATQDEKFRVIDSRSGKTLKEFQLPAGGYATPATYMAKGKQFVVIAAGGGGFQLTKPGDTYVAYSVHGK